MAAVLFSSKLCVNGSQSSSGLLFYGVFIFLKDLRPWVVHSLHVEAYDSM